MFDRWPSRSPDHRQRRDHEPRRDRGRALTGLAGCQRGAERRPGAEPRAPSRSSTCSTTGSAATRRVSTPTSTAPSTRPAQRSSTTPWRPIAEAVMEPRFEAAPRRAERRPQPRRPLRRVLRRQGPTDAARREGQGSTTCATAGRRPRRLPGLALGRDRRERRRARHRLRQRRPGELARAGEHDRLRAGHIAEPVPDDEPADLPAGPRAPAR